MYSVLFVDYKLEAAETSIAMLLTFSTGRQKCKSNLAIIVLRGKYKQVQYTHSYLMY